jgi:hypothetical protein
VFATGVGPAHVYYLVSNFDFINTGQSYPFGLGIPVVSDLVFLYGVQVFYGVPFHAISPMK